MPNPVQKQMNGEELAEVSTPFEVLQQPNHSNGVHSTQSEGIGPGLDHSFLAKRLELASAAAEAVFKKPDIEPKFEPDDVDSARAAVEYLESLFASVPGILTVVIENARSGAELLSGDPLQGLSEIVQNADDVDATEVRFLLQPDALLIAHNGRPVRLRDVLALATPWDTTKRNDSKAIGRFGIGLMTLQALSDTFDLHSGPYNVRFGDPILTAIEPFSIPPGFANTDDTIFRVPLDGKMLNSETLSEWAKTWDDPALLFCTSVSRVTIHASNSMSHTLELRWQEGTTSQATIGGVDTPVRRRRATAPDGRMWEVHTAEALPPEDVHRAHKATGSSVPLGIALSLNGTDAGQLYAGLPVAHIAHAVRVNAQFDPLTNRQGLAHTPWNTAVSVLVADLWKAATLDMFATNPPTAWQSIPLPGSLSQSGTGAVTQFEAMLLSYAREKLPSLVKIQVGDRHMPLTQLATEVPRVTSILNEREIAELAGMSATLPFNARDPKERWRSVLDDWRTSGAHLAQPLSVRKALALFGRDDCSVQQTIALASAALDEHLGFHLVRLPCIMTRDGARLRPPEATDPWIFVTRAPQLAQELGIARVLHEAYSADGEDAQQVWIWLQKQDAILDATDVTGVLRRLAAAGHAGNSLENPLTDSQLLAIRDAFEDLSESDREKLGPDVGRAIVIHGYQFEKKGNRIRTPASPANMYLPRRIDKEPDSFAVAAGETPGLTWVDGRYENVLRSPLGRGGLGAQRFLRLLGVETAPRLLPHPDLVKRYEKEFQRGLPMYCDGSPRERITALTTIGATYTLADKYCPDLIDVLWNISRDRETPRRHKRASALLATLGRAWDHFSESAEVLAANNNYAWHRRGTIKAFWIWQAKSIPWLSDSCGKPTAPTDLRLRTPGTVAVHGPDAEGYLHDNLQQARRNVLELFGVTGDPNTSDLVERLRALRDSGPDDVERILVETSIIYQALADRLASRVKVPGDLSIGSLRQAFAAGKGLILANLGWRQPSQVLEGAPVFGNRRAFTPSVPSTARLWSDLQVRTPTVADCVEVLNEIAKDSRQPDTTQQTIILETLRYMATDLSRTDKTSDSINQKLTKLPLWTGKKWRRTRPIYAIRDLLLADSLRSQVAVWDPGGELSQFESLLAPLRITEISIESASVVHGATVSVDEVATSLLRDAIALLREDFARNDPEAGNSLCISWDLFSQFEVRVVPDLLIEIAGVPKLGPLIVPVHAFTDVRASTLYVTESYLIWNVEAGGQAIAKLFTANRRRVAQAWLAACVSAHSGREALLLKLAADRQKEEEAQRKLEIERRKADLRNETQMAHSQPHALHTDASRLTPTDVPETDATALDEEFNNFPFDVQIDPVLADVTLNVGALSDRHARQEVVNGSIPHRLSASHTTSYTAFSPDSNGKDNNLTRLSSSKNTLPPIASVAPMLLEPLDDWSPKDSKSNGTGRKEYWASPAFVNEDYKKEVGQRGEEIIYLQEVERVKRLGFPEARVVWIAKNNPLADFDILSVDENGRDLWLEVKSTIGRNGHFQWSIAEFTKAIQKREHYILWRVYEADTIHPSIKPFRDPVGMISSNGIQLDVASLSAEVEPL